MNYAIILAGGIGSRFWPLSRVLFPKQFINIKGNLSLLQATIKRIAPIIKKENIFIVTNKAYLRQIKQQTKIFSLPEENIILEPKALNTAPAISLCAQLIRARDKEANLVILPSDHFIKGNKDFRDSVLRALRAAEDGFLVTIGIKPQKPVTGFGYIETTGSLGKNILGVKSFIEKPPLAKVKKIYLKKGIYWNAGIFCWKAEVFLSELKACLPSLYSQIVKIKNKADIKRTWKKIKPISVDYAVLERSKRIALVPADFTWTDLGSWDAFCDIFPIDKNNNIISADAVSIDSKNNIVLGKGKRLITTVGLKNTIIIDTADALLVCDKDSSQDIRRLVDCLKRKKRKECIKMPS